jgi:hypothetical protein
MDVGMDSEQLEDDIEVGGGAAAAEEAFEDDDVLSTEDEEEDQGEEAVDEEVDEEEEEDEEDDEDQPGSRCSHTQKPAVQQPQSAAVACHSQAVAYMSLG